MNKSHLLGALCAVLFTFITVSANAALVSRLSGQAAYDTVLDITWTTDASLSGAWFWDNQVGWARGLDTANYLGVDGWRLASISVAAGLPTGTTTTSVAFCNTTEPACRDNELGYMFYYNLGGSSTDNLTGNQTVGDVTLTDIQPLYWSGTEFDSNEAWYFFFGSGDDTGKTFKNNNLYGWAVVDGDVFIPLPAAAWLFGSGLLGLVGIARRRKEKPPSMERKKNTKNPSEVADDADKLTIKHM